MARCHFPESRLAVLLVNIKQGRIIRFSKIAFCLALSFWFSAVPFFLQAQEPTAPIPASKKPAAVRLLFLPPPMEGTISMGIYDASGKLTRTLCREASTDDFVAAPDGLAATWDGRNDSGTDAAPGKYSAHGFMVGDILIEGEAFQGNDWISSETSPRIRRILQVLASDSGALLKVELADGKRFDFSCSAQGNINLMQLPETENATPAEAVDAKKTNEEKLSSPDKTAKPRLAIRNHQVVLVHPDGQSESLPNLDSLTNPQDASFGRAESIWVIDRTAEETTQVKQYTKDGELLRRLMIEPQVAQPIQIAASEQADVIFLLEETGSSQRFRALELASPTAKSTPGEQPTSTWKVTLNKTITLSDSLENAIGKLTFPDGKAFAVRETIPVQLRPNPLIQEQPSSVEIGVGFDANGSYLKTGDGLFLKRISETPCLKWAAIGRQPESKAAIIFQSDGAVIEEFKVSRLANMMAFDCGGFTLSQPAVASPRPSASPSPSP